MIKNKKPRILIGLTEIAGSASGLCQGFRQMGYECDFINRFPHPFKYSGSDHWATLFLHRMSYLTAPPWRKKWPFRQVWQKALALFRGFLFVWALTRYDVFIFYFQITFSNNLWDLPILKFFGKKIIFVFVGSDSRPAYLDGFHDKNPDNKDDVKWLIDCSGQQKKRLQKTEKYADYIVNWIPHSYFHERNFILGTIMGFAQLIAAPNSACDGAGAGTVKRKLKVLHAPSNQSSKGTDAIRQSMAKLKSKGYDFEYMEISGRPNHEVMAALSDCDFVIDQLYSDTPLAGFAAEAAFFGKPAVVGGYYSDFIYQDIEKDFIPPSLYVLPEKIEDAVELLLRDERFRLNLGDKAKIYVRNYMQPQKVAERFLRLINDEVPENWWRDPYDIKYLYGFGLSREKLKNRLRSVVESGGSAALKLDDKPKLRDSLITMAYEEDADA